MKRLSISTSVFLLTFLVLLGSGGFTVGKMICGANECSSVSYSLGKAKDCCASENAPAESISKSCCCELIDVSYSLDEFSVSEKLTVSALEFDFLYLPTAYCQLPASQTSVALNSLQDIPPPNCREYLHFIGSLLL